MKKPARIIPRNYRVPTGVMPIAGSRGVAFEGTLERDFYLLMRFEPGFMTMESQPIRIEYEVDGRKHHYTPDALVYFHASSGRRPMLCEIKPHAELKEKWPEYRRRFKAAVRYARSLGWTFRIFTEKKIRTPRLANLRMFSFHLQQPTVDALKTARLQKAVRTQENPTFNSVLGACGPGVKRIEWLSSMWCALATGLIGVDIDVPILGDSPVWNTSVAP